MRFEWDKNKAESNLKKHGVTFDEAVSVFYDPFAATFADPDHSVSEHRWITVGYSVLGRLIVLCHTDRRGVVRIISARKATANERKKHETQK
ncbi:MAG: BrnT family toxin [bacterium]|nr:BrnT family toxin [bacterium]